MPSSSSGRWWPGAGRTPRSQAAGGAGGRTADESADPVVRKLTKAEWARMVEVGMAGPNCPVQRKNLRRLEINHVNFDGEVKRGAIVVRGDVVESVTRIFTRLFEKRFPIHRMTPVEAFNGSDQRSMKANNTSAYNCRRPSEANSPSMKSPHANGRAIDINPIQNPWLNPRTHVWEPSGEVPQAHRRAGQDSQERPGLAAVHPRGLDLAGHRDAGLPALRHRLPVAAAEDR